MALAIDASGPAIAIQNSNTVMTVTTASFTPPAGSLLYVRWAWNNGSADVLTAPSIVDNRSVPLSYTLLDFASHNDVSTIQGMAAHWVAPVTSLAAMTITTTANGPSTNSAGAVIVLVLTDGTGTPRVGVHGKANSASGASIAQTYTALYSGAMGFIGVADWDIATHAAGTGMTAANGGTGTDGTSGKVAHAFWRRTTADDVVGATQTLNDTITGVTAHLYWVYAEILSAKVDPVAVSQAVPRSFNW